MSSQISSSSTDVARLVATVAERGLQRLDQPVRLASGAMSSEFIDGKLALSEAGDLRAAARLIVAIASEQGIEWDAVGGLTMGADALAVAVALEGNRPWFLVRKAAKDRGTRRLLEGSRLGRGVRVMVIDDVVTTGGSIITAIEAAESAGAQVVVVTTLADRGDTCAEILASRGIAYHPLMTYRDLDIPPVVPPDAHR